MPPPRQAHWGSRIEEVHSTERAALQPPLLLVQILQRWTQIDPPSTVCSLSRLRGRVREGALSTADSVARCGTPTPALPPLFFPLPRWGGGGGGGPLSTADSVARCGTPTPALPPQAGEGEESAA